jgi:2-keto-myo-inositol isomerase
MTLLHALNQKTARHLPFAAFLDLAQSLGCVGVEARNDLGRPLFDGLPPGVAGQMVRERGLRLLGVSEVYAFNVWDAERERQVQALIAAAVGSGAETFNLIPCVDDRGPAVGQRDAVLRGVLREVAGWLKGLPLRALVEPIGFVGSSLRTKAALVDAIEAVGVASQIQLVHDTFQHTLAAEAALFAPYTGLVHISGISNPHVQLDEVQDAHRVLVDASDRCATLEQMAALRSAGYRGAYSFECTAPEVAASPTLQQDVAASFHHIEGALGWSVK